MCMCVVSFVVMMVEPMNTMVAVEMKENTQTRIATFDMNEAPSALPAIRTLCAVRLSCSHSSTHITHLRKHHHTIAPAHNHKPP